MSDSSVFKLCNRCRVVKPATREFFYAQHTNPHGLQTACKACVSARGKSLRVPIPRVNKHKQKRLAAIDDPETFSDAKDVRRIQLTGARGSGQFALVDADVYYALARLSWSVNSKGYVVGTNNKLNATITLHRLVVPEVLVGQMLDHINRNPLDNRRCNLRVCSPSENARNQSKQSGDVTSVFKGVTLHQGGWSSRITFERKTEFLGFFRNEIAAALAYDEAARFLFKQFASTNYPGIVARSPDDIRALSRPVRSSKYEGVDLYQRIGKWRSRISGNHLGLFNSEAEAIEANQIAQVM